MIKALPLKPVRVSCARVRRLRGSVALVLLLESGELVRVGFRKIDSHRDDTFVVSNVRVPKSNKMDFMNMMDFKTRTVALRTHANTILCQ